MQWAGFGIRPACAADVDSMMRMKAQLAAAENAAFALRWTHADWVHEGAQMPGSGPMWLNATTQMSVW
jgi:hypothetical protein